MPPQKSSAYKIIPYSLFWEGVDGPWATFILQIGSPPQEVHVLPSTSLSETLIVGPGGCPNSTDFSGVKFQTSKQEPKTACSDSRGKLYDLSVDNSKAAFDASNKSNISVYNVEAYQTLKNFGGDFPAYGFHSNVTIGYTQADIQASASQSIQLPLLQFYDPNYAWVGLLGIDPRPANFTSGTPPQTSMEKSLLQSLKDSGEIKSMSWAYTAGSYNRGRIYPSLTLGGYDSNRFIPNNVKFKYDADLEAPYMVDISYIHLNGTINGTLREVDLYPSKMEAKGSQFPGVTKAIIDSNLPYMHLPQSVCDQIALAYNLSYNETMNRYIIPDNVDQALSNSGATVTISLTSITDKSQSVNITLPYPSLNLYDGYPFGNGQRYFPMRPAVYPGKYSLGRAFLQEAYMIADHDRNEFSVSQVNWAMDVSKTNMVALSPTDPQKKVAIAGIIGGAIGGCLVLAVFLYFCCRKAKIKVNIAVGKRKDDTTDTRSSEAKDGQSTPTSPDDEVNPIEAPTNVIHEVDGTGLPPPVEMDAKTVNELPDQSGTLAEYYKEAELDGTNEKPIFEMEGSPVKRDLASNAGPSPSSSDSANVSPDTSASGSRITNNPLSIQTRFKGLHDSIESTVISGVSSLSSGRDTVPPLPQIPIESRSSRGVRDRLNGHEIPPASPIPKTPLEFYGNQIPESRWREAKIHAIQQKLGRERYRLVDPTINISDDDISSSSSPPDHEEKDRSLSQKQNDRSLPPINTKVEKIEKEKMPLTTRKSDFSHLGVLPEPGPNSPIASPIPKTPLEYYRQPPSLPLFQSTRTGKSPAKRETDHPSFTVTPATPSSPTNQVVTESGVPIELLREQRPPSERQDKESTKIRGHEVERDSRIHPVV